MSIRHEVRCPTCHALMEEGFIPTGGGMHWFRKRDASAVDFAEAVPGTFCWLRRVRLPAWRCKKCHIITFRYGKDAGMLPEQLDLSDTDTADEPEEDTAGRSAS